MTEPCLTNASEQDDAATVEPSELVCGIPTEELDSFGAMTKYVAIPVWRRLRRTMTAWHNRTQKQIAELQTLLAEARKAAPARDEGEERWEKLRARLEAIEGEELEEGEQRRRKLAAVVESLDLVMFAQTLEASMGRQKTEAHKIVAQMVGLLEKEKSEAQAPTFVWNVVALPGPQDAAFEEDFERQLRLTTKTTAVLASSSG